ncbi:ubiquitin-associated protein 1-like [Electrophorus electricus]|uniref:ubiquitin-associated protein 1-like n=1 Tax=Electrophorus electricus TaxID=8005 RepID=UPI0015D0B327|nr:ubiquitin-associated protein 1-like [Electrophorus electricus]
MTSKEYCRTGSLDDVPFMVPLGCLRESQGVMELVTATEINVPDYYQILQDTQYVFSLENWVLTKLQSGPQEERGVSTHGPMRASVAPSCPPYCLLFRSPQERRAARLCCKALCDGTVRPRSLSLGAAESRQPPLPRSVHFHIVDSECEGAGYCEDDERSSPEDEVLVRGAPRRPPPLLRSAAQLPQAHVPRSLAPLPKGSTSSPHTQRPSRRRTVSGCCSWKRNKQCRAHPRPSSAGPLPSAQLHRNATQAVRPQTSHGGHSTGVDSSVELLCALSEEERELLETVTAQGYTLRTAILALQRTGQHGAEQTLKYLLACDRLCALGYEKTQVEDALEMFQNCESKASEFLCLLAQFCEMGFQQSAIKEVLLLHENHRERALEELMTRVA